jgi:excisionase family DNA binding protein
MEYTLVPVKETFSLQPAAFRELEAAKYIGSNRTDFRRLVDQGAIPYTAHVGHRSRIYLREDLDAYLRSLPRRTMPVRENSLVALKGASR